MLQIYDYPFLRVPAGGPNFEKLRFSVFLRGHAGGLDFEKSRFSVFKEPTNHVFQFLRDSAGGLDFEK